MKKKGLKLIAILSLAGLGLGAIAGCTSTTPSGGDDKSQGEGGQGGGGGQGGEGQGGDVTPSADPKGTISLTISDELIWAGKTYTITAQIGGTDFDLEKAAIKYQVPEEIVDYSIQGAVISFTTQDEYAKDVKVSATLYTDNNFTTALATAEVTFDIHKTIYELELEGQKTTFKQGEAFTIGDLQVSLIETKDGEEKDPVEIPRDEYLVLLDDEEPEEGLVLTAVQEHTVTVIYETKNVEETYTIAVEENPVYSLTSWFEDSFKAGGTYGFALTYGEGDEAFDVASESVGTGEGFYVDYAQGQLYREEDYQGTKYINHYELYEDDQEALVALDHGIVYENFGDLMDFERFVELHSDKLIYDMDAAGFAGLEYIAEEEGVYEFKFEGELGDGGFVDYLVDKFYGIDDLAEVLEVTSLPYAFEAHFDAEGDFEMAGEFKFAEGSAHALSMTFALTTDETIAEKAFAAVDSQIAEGTIGEGDRSAVDALIDSATAGELEAQMLLGPDGYGIGGILGSYYMSGLVVSHAGNVGNIALVFNASENKISLYPWLIVGAAHINEKQYVDKASGKMVAAGDYLYENYNDDASTYQAFPIVGSNHTIESIDELAMYSSNITGLMTYNDGSKDTPLWNFEDSSGVYLHKEEYYIDLHYTLYGSMFYKGNVFSPLDYANAASFVNDHLGLEEEGIDCTFKTDLYVSYKYSESAGFQIDSYVAKLYGANSEDIDENLGLVDTWYLNIPSEETSDYAYDRFVEDNFTAYINGTRIGGLRNLSMTVGDTTKLNPTVTGEGGKSPTEKAEFTFEVTEGEGVVSVDEAGTVTALAAGEAKILVTDTVHNLSKEITVTVAAAEEEGGQGGQGGEPGQGAIVRNTVASLTTGAKVMDFNTLPSANFKTLK